MSQSWRYLFPCFIHKASTYIAIHIYSDNYINMYIEILEDVHTHARISSVYPQGLELSFHFS